MDMAIVAWERDVGEGVEMISIGGSKAVGRLLGGVLGSTIGEGGKTGDSAVETDPPAENEFKDGDSSSLRFPAARDDSPCWPPLACLGRLEALALSYSAWGLSGMGIGDAGRLPAALEDSLDVDACFAILEDSGG